MQGFDSLDLFDFGVLLQALSSNLKIGVLAVRSGHREKYLQLDKSKLTRIYTRRPRATLEKVLFNHRAIEKEPLREAIRWMDQHPEEGPLDKLLVDRQMITPLQASIARQYQTVEEVLELFYWKNVGFEFYGGNAEELLADEQVVPVGDAAAVDTLLLRCTKIIDDIAKFNEVTPSLRDVYELQIDSLETLRRLVPDPHQREFVLLIDGVRDMREVLRDMRMNRYEVLEFFYSFRKQGWIRPKNAFELLMLAENRRKEFSHQKRARILERVAELGVEGFKVLLPLAETYEEMGNPPKAAAYYIRHARRCLENEEFDGAKHAVRRATRLVPNDPDLRAFEIDLYEKVGDSESAAAAYKALAEIREQRGQTWAALTALRNASRLFPGDATTWWHLADLFERTDRKRVAACCMRRAGDMMKQENDGSGAEQAYRRAIELWPSAWSPRYRLVDLLHTAGRDDIAVQVLAELVDYVNKKLDMLPKERRVEHLTMIEKRLRNCGGLLSSAAGQLAHAYAMVDERERAIDLFRESASSLTSARRHTSAVRMWEGLIELDSKDLEARKNLARSHRALADHNRALGQLRRVGATYVNREEYEPAIEIFQEMLDVDPTCLDAHTGYARALLRIGQSEKAAEHFHRVGLLHRGCGRAEEAVPYLREAVEQRPNDAELLEEYCELLMRAGKTRELVDALSKYVDLRMAQGSPSRAAIALTRILEIDSRHPGARRILHQAAKQLMRLAESSEEIPVEAAREIIKRTRGRSLRPNSDRVAFDPMTAYEPPPPPKKDDGHDDADADDNEVGDDSQAGLSTVREDAPGDEFLADDEGKDVAAEQVEAAEADAEHDAGGAADVGPFAERSPFFGGDTGEIEMDAHEVDTQRSDYGETTGELSISAEIAEANRFDEDLGPGYAEEEDDEDDILVPRVTPREPPKARRAESAPVSTEIL